MSIKDTIYGEDVEIIVYVRNEDVENLESRIIDITNAKANITLGEEYYLSEKGNKLIL